VIAVNNDKQARIFDYADYGIMDDVKNIKENEIC
jgi:electron transfer flavoprotein alpha subunit